MSEEPAAPVVVDGEDRSCVQLLLELRGHVRDLPHGTQVHLIAADPAAPLDLAAWCHMTGHVYLGRLGGHDRPTYGIGVAGAARETSTASPWRPA
ncbi:sulfurtransferase TusA family protein [Nocardiopsis kunsanensis]|uniref:Sulfurtransferase TusA family protein n=1 Tax=Nocardiopsis kunsanensis TaxID=141693 RepID=A0A918XG37_9ACTN|nr:hypothetical protein [Nocardiopsis kunsanensis]GHD29302.1 hypothetical protein GCM10007147_29930 [Nocardiopsis kunsanensis]